VKKLELPKPEKSVLLLNITKYVSGEVYRLDLPYVSLSLEFKNKNLTAFA
jgi:hypothetical protein